MDDVLLYAPANTTQEGESLQHNLTAVSCWSDHLQLALNPAKCEALAITNKRSPIKFTYTISQKSVSWSNLVCYLGVNVNSKLRWSSHCQIISAKAIKTLNCIKHLMFGCSREAKSKAYKPIVRPILEYAYVMWSPCTIIILKT